MKVCAICFIDIEGGTYIEKEGRKIYFCSGNCLNEFEDNNVYNQNTQSNPIT